MPLRERFPTKYQLFHRDSFKSKRLSTKWDLRQRYLSFVHHPVWLNPEVDETKSKGPQPTQEIILPLNIRDWSPDPVVLPGLKKDRTSKDKLYHDRGTILAPRLLNLFSRWLNLRLPVVRIHQNNDSEEFLRERQADAMTIGTDIYFGPGKFDLNSARGLGLLGHELTHVAQQQTGDWRSTSDRIGSERAESSAIDSERFILRNAKMISRQKEMASASRLSAAVPHSSASESVTPMFADESRTINEVPDETMAPFNSVTITESEMSRIKEEVYRDLMMRIKTEFERGA